MNGLRQQFHHVAKPNVGKTGQIQIQKNKDKIHSNTLKTTNTSSSPGHAEDCG